MISVAALFLAATTTSLQVSGIMQTRYVGGLLTHRQKCYLTLEKNARKQCLYFPEVASSFTDDGPFCVGLTRQREAGHSAGIQAGYQ